MNGQHHYVAAAGGDRLAGRRRRARAAALAEITQAGRRILAGQGQQALGLRGIARETGLTASALYRYFGSYEDLISHLTADIFAEATGDVRAAITAAGRASHGDRAAKLAAARQAFRRWSLNHRAEFTLAFAAPLPRVGQDDAAAQSARRFAWAFLEVFLDQWQDHPLRVPPLAMTAEAAAALDYLRGWLQADLPPGALVAYLGWWARLHTAVALEVSGYPGIAPSEADSLQVDLPGGEPGNKMDAAKASNGGLLAVG